MKKYLSLALIFLFNFNIFSSKVLGSESYKIYYPKKDEFETIIYKECEFIGEFYQEEKIIFLLKQLFKYNCIKGIFLEKGNLYINFNEDILNETKSSLQEISKIKSVCSTIFQFKNIKTISFLKEGEFFNMSGGSNIFKFTRNDLLEL